MISLKIQAHSKQNAPRKKLTILFLMGIVPVGSSRGARTGRFDRRDRAIRGFLASSYHKVFNLLPL